MTIIYVLVIIQVIGRLIIVYNPANTALYNGGVEMYKFISSLLFVVAVLALTSLAYVLYGIAFVLLWGWFIVPIFGLPSLSIVPAIGICILIGLLTYHGSNTDKITWRQVLGLYLSPIFAIIAGYVVHLFM